MCLAHFIAPCKTMYFSTHINRALWDVMSGISRLVNGMGQWTWNLCHIPALVTLPHIAEIFWSYITLLCGHSTVRITRRGSGPCRSNARSVAMRLLSVFRWQLQLRLPISIDALIGSLGYFRHGSAECKYWTCVRCNVFRNTGFVGIQWNLRYSQVAMRRERKIVALTDLGIPHELLINQWNYYSARCWKWWSKRQRQMVSGDMKCMRVPPNKPVNTSLLSTNTKRQLVTKIFSRSAIQKTAFNRIFIHWCYVTISLCRLHCLVKATTFLSFQSVVAVWLQTLDMSLLTIFLYLSE